jgi:hypothetical protein
MDWKQLLAEQRVEAAPHATAEELAELRAKVDRNLGDAAIAGLSDEGCFGLAYDAARTLAVIAIRASGYRVKQPAAHYNTFIALRAVGEPALAAFVSYLNICRQKRNEVNYDTSVVTRREAQELLQKARDLRARHRGR